MKIPGCENWPRSKVKLCIFPFSLPFTNKFTIYEYYIREKIEVLCTILGDDSADSKETEERKGKKNTGLT